MEHEVKIQNVHQYWYRVKNYVKRQFQRCTPNGSVSFLITLMLKIIPYSDLNSENYVPSEINQESDVSGKKSLIYRG